MIALQDLMLVAEGIAAAVALWHYKTVKEQYWKYFVYFLTIIFLSECLGKWGNWDSHLKMQFYNYFAIPLQLLFFYWLYAAKTFKNKKLFFLFSILYVISYLISEIFFKEHKVFKSFNYTFGCLLLMILVIKEYYRQINSADILKFSRNRMFYINLGVTLFYIGTLPCITFYSFLKNYDELYTIYFGYYFAISVIIMYLLFAISFIWGKQNSY